MPEPTAQANPYPTPAQDAADAALAEEIEEELAEEENN